MKPNRDLGSIRIRQAPWLPISSVLFYKQSGAEDFKIYSPYQDGPDALIDSTNAINDPQTALKKIIKTALGNEIANLTLSIFPNRAGRTNTKGTVTLESDSLLNKIRDYRNLPENRDLLERRRALLEGVTHRVLLGQDFSDLSAMATRDAANQASIHYLLRVLNPGDFVLGKDSSQRVYYSLSVESQLLTSEGKLIYSDTQKLQEYLTSDQVDRLRSRSLAVGGRLAAVPGKYRSSVSRHHEPGDQAKFRTNARHPGAGVRPLAGNEPGRVLVAVSPPARFCTESTVQLFRHKNPSGWSG